MMSTSTDLGIDAIQQAHAVLHTGIEPVTMSNTELDTHSLLMSLHEKVTCGFESMNTKLCDMQSTISNVVKEVNDLKTCVGIQEAKLEQVEKDLIPKLENRLERQIKALEDARLQTELYSKKSNLLFFNIQQEGKNEDTEDVLRTHLNELGVHQADDIIFMNVHRLPTKTPTSNSPQPIIAKFLRMKDRNMILSFKPTSGNKLQVAPHLPAIMQAERRRLVPIRNKHILEGKTAQIRVTGINVQLVVNGTVSKE